MCLGGNPSSELKNDTEHNGLGSDHFDRRSKDAKVKRLTAQLAKLGFKVRTTPMPAASSLYGL